MAATSTTTVTPFLTVKNATNAVAFYISAFRGTLLASHEIPGDKWMFQLGIEGAVFWVGDEEPEFGNLSPDLETNNSTRMILQTNNADELFDKAMKLGALQICPMTTEQDWRIGKLKDPFGHTWELGYPLAD